MTLSNSSYESLKRSVSKIYETSDLAVSLRSRANEDKELAAVMRDFFSDDEEQCADFVRQNSAVTTSIIASVKVHSAELTASLDADDELTEFDARDFVQDNFSFGYVDTHDYASIDVEDVQLHYCYKMHDFSAHLQTA